MNRRELFGFLGSSAAFAVMPPTPCPEVFPTTSVQKEIPTFLQFLADPKVHKLLRSEGKKINWSAVGEMVEAQSN